MNKYMFFVLLLLVLLGNGCMVVRTTTYTQTPQGWSMATGYDLVPIELPQGSYYQSLAPVPPPTRIGIGGGSYGEPYVEKSGFQDHHQQQTGPHHHNGGKGRP